MIKPTFLVLVPEEIREASGAMRYASLSAKAAGGCVALLAVVEPEEIGTWGGVDKVITDDAFDRARGVVAHFSTFVKDVSGADPHPLYVKGIRREALLGVIETEPDISALVLTCDVKEDGQNDLIKYFTSPKGMKKLTVPLIIVPDSFYEEKEDESKEAAKAMEEEKKDE